MYIKNLLQKAERACCDVPAARSTYPARGSACHSTGAPAVCVSSCILVLWVRVSCDIMMDMEK